MTITEFLEARITEDEQQIRDWDRSTPFDLERLMAECAAKRAIIAFDEDIQVWDPRGFSSDTASEAFHRGGPKDPHARHVTRILAAVYAGHPDFRMEWLL